METRPFGRTGHNSSVLVYGAAALSDVPDEVADRSIELALDAGINHVDTSVNYGDSEIHLGRWMSRMRDRIYLATKTGDRSAAAAYDSVRRSLERLRTDDIDLMQIHAVGDLADLDQAMRSGGAIDGLVKAKEEGLVRSIGITGHGMGAPATHLEALRRFPFDSVLTPWNFALACDQRYTRDFEALLEVITERGVGLRTIKTIARSLWSSSGTQSYQTWYQPIDQQAYVTATLAFVLARPEVTGVCTAGDVRLLPLLIQAEREWRAVTPDQIRSTLSSLPEYEPLFIKAAGREAPEWLVPLMQEPSER